jgi:hypothetical protein
VHDNVSSPPVLQPCWCDCCILHGPQEGHLQSTTGVAVVPARTPTPLVDEHLRASLLRQGKVGLTRKAGRRKRKFKTAEEARQFPIPYHGQSQKDWRAKQLSFLVGMSYRLMKAHGDWPLIGTTPGREAPSSAMVDKYQELVFQEALNAAGDHLVSSLSHSGRWVPTFTQGEDGRNRYKTTPGEVTFESLDKLCRIAFAFAWDNWDHAYYEKLSTWGRKGGQISRRKPVYTPDILDPWLGLSKKEQAAKLDVSPRTIANLRAKHHFYKKDNI